jgi:hypothetical protein
MVQDIIRHAHDSTATLGEVQILSDADTLDDMGALGIWRELRRSILEGRAVEDAVRVWQRREQYGYWDSRMRDAFRLDTARRLAQSRLASARSFMMQLSCERDASDLTE